MALSNISSMCDYITDENHFNLYDYGKESYYGVV